MTFKKKLAVLSFAALGFAQGAAPVHAGGPLSRLKPAQGLTMDVGSKRAVAYFLAENSACNVTVMLSEATTHFDHILLSPTRVNMSVGAGTSARIDTIDGPSLSLSCAPGAAVLGVQTVERTAYIATQQGK